MDQDQQDRPAIPRLLREAHELIAPLLDSPAVSPGERERLGALHAEAVDQQAPSAIRRYRNTAVRTIRRYRNTAGRIMLDAGFDAGDTTLISFDHRIDRILTLATDQACGCSGRPGIAGALPVLAAIPDAAPARTTVRRAGEIARLVEASAAIVGIVRDHLDPGDPGAAAHAANLRDAVTNLHAALALLPGPTAVHPAARIVLAAPGGGDLFERGAAPDQLWPTANPLAALNWPDLPTALAAITSPGFKKAHAKAKAAGYALKRAVVLVEDLGAGEIESAVAGQAGGQAVAG